MLIDTIHCYVNNLLCVHMTLELHIREYISLKTILYSCVCALCEEGDLLLHYGSRILLLSIEMWSLATFYSMAIWSPKYQILAYPRQILKWIHIYQQDQQALLGKHCFQLQYKERLNGNNIFIIILQIPGSRVLPTPPINHCKWCVWLWSSIARIAHRPSCHRSQAYGGL